MTTAPTSQYNLNEAYNVACAGLRDKPVNTEKTATKNVYVARNGYTIDTYIDCGDTIKKEVSRRVPDEGIFIVISETLKNSTEYKQKYFIPYDDFIKRYEEMDGSEIEICLWDKMYQERQVKSKGKGKAFKANIDDTINGQYENPESWGDGIADGAKQEGYWMCSNEKPTEWYFVPLEYFNRDYKILNTLTF